MKNNYFTFLFMLLSATSIAQIHQLPPANDAPIKPIPIFGKPTLPTSGEECFCFEYYTDPNAWLNAYDALVNSQYEQFFAFQRDAIEEEIEQQLNEDFPNYEQAVKDLFRNEATYDFENDFINDLIATTESLLETTTSQGQLTQDLSNLFNFVYANSTGSNIDFGELRHNGQLLETMSASEAWYLYNDLYGTEMNNLYDDANDLAARYNTLGHININNILANYLANQMYAHHKSYPDYQEIQQISAYLIYYANTNAPGPYNNTPGLFDDLDYYTIGQLDGLSNNIIESMINSNNVGGSVPYWVLQDSLEDIKFIYSTTEQNLDATTSEFLNNNTSVKNAAATFMSTSNYSSFSASNVVDVISNFQSGDRLLPYSHTYGENINGQSLDRPDRIFYMQWDNDGLSAGYNTISHLLEGLSNIPGNYNDGNFIVNIFEQNIPGFTFNSEINYGLLFDFDYTAGGISIEFSPYALEHILGDLEVWDNVYDFDLFFNPYKIYLLQVLTDGGFVNFGNPPVAFHPDFNQYPCHKQIINSLYQSNTAITNLFQDLFNETNRDFVTFVPKPNLTGLANTVRNFILENSYFIDIQQEGLASSDLALATIVTHELLHASLNRIYNDGQGFVIPDLPAGETPLYSELLDGFIQSEVGTNALDQHNFMNNYRDLIAETTYFWATNYGGYTGDTALLNHLKRVAWVGLRFEQGSIGVPTPAWEIFINQTNNSVEVLEIGKVIEAELYPFANEILVNGVTFDASSIRKGTEIDCD